MVMEFRKNALYVHGFMGNPKGGTFETLQKTFGRWSIHSIPFADLHTDIAKTQMLIKDYCRENEIDILIGASLGAFYVLQHEDLIDKLVINPCVFPSVEIPKLNDRTTGNPLVLSEEVLSVFREMEKYEDISEEQRLRTFGIFAKDDELFHFKDTFDKLFGIRGCRISNSIMVNGHHSIEEEYLRGGLELAGKYLEDRTWIRTYKDNIHWLIKSKKDSEEKAMSFDFYLTALTHRIVLEGRSSSDEYYSYSKALKELFDSFAIIDEFDSWLIVRCYNIIKISMMLWEHAPDKSASFSANFKDLLDYFYKVMKEIYFHEIFGFFSTTVHPEDVSELNLPCKVFCGCADGWQREPYIDEEGTVEYANVVRFQDPGNNEVPFCIIIDGSARLLEPREKCSLTDKQLNCLCQFVNHNRGSIILHNSGVLDSKQFIDSLKLRDRIYKSKYCIEFEYVKYVPKADFRHPSGPYYVDMNDMTFEKALKFYKKLWKEIRLESEDLNADYPLYSLKVIKRRPALNSCCFCKKIFNGDGNSTWPIYYKQDSEHYRCCDECNEKYVIAARKNRALIMQFRNLFGIDYTEYGE